MNLTSAKNKIISTYCFSCCLWFLLLSLSVYHFTTISVTTTMTANTDVAPDTCRGPQLSPSHPSDQRALFLLALHRPSEEGCGPVRYLLSGSLQKP